jgi:hypothetical protein
MLFWCLWGGRMKLDATSVRYYLELFVGGGNSENPQADEVGVVSFRSPNESRA